MSGRCAVGVRVALGAVALVPLIGGCGVGSNGDIEGERAAIVNGTMTTDTTGNVYLTAGCSGTLLTPQWVLTAGHCLNSRLGLIQNLTSVGVYLGNSTTNGKTSTELYTHPNWWHPGLTVSTPPSLTNWDVAYDVSLVRLPTPFSTAGYPNFVINNPLSNRAPAAGQTVRCFGYGYTTVSYTGGGAGQLQSALLPVLNVTNIGNGYPTGAPMIELTPNANGQSIYDGDSGGGCSLQAPSAEPNVIGVNEGIVQPATGTMPTQGWLVQASTVHEWIDQTMHGDPQSLGTPAGTPSFTSACSTPSMNGDAIYVVAGYTGSLSGGTRLYMRAFSNTTGWSAWSALSTSHLPAGGISSRVALSAVSYYPGVTQLMLAVIGADKQMYVATLAPGFGPGANWTSMTWAPTGGIFLAGTQPSIVFIGTRIDVFGIGTTSNIYTRWKNDYNSTTWNNDWTPVPSPMTFAQGASVTYSKGAYVIVSLSDGGAANPNPGANAFIAQLTGLTSTNYGTWTGWTGLGGIFMGTPAITAWQGGLAIYGIGTNSSLYRGTHNFSDDISVWSGWMNLNKGTFTQPEGVSANTSWEQASKIDVVTSNGTPQLIPYPK